jgi:hypothetical protein
VDEIFQLWLLNNEKAWSILAPGSLLSKALLAPDIRFVMVASLLPKTQLVFAEKLQSAQPLGTFPEVGCY